MKKENRKRVSRFLKRWERTTGSNHIVTIPGTGLALWATDLADLVAIARAYPGLERDYKAVAAECDALTTRIAELEQETAPELPELDIEPLEGVEFNDARYQTRTAPDGTEWEWITKAERTGYARKIDELRGQLDDAWKEIPVDFGKPGGRLAGAVRLLRESREYFLGRGTTLESQVVALSQRIRGRDAEIEKLTKQKVELDDIRNEFLPGVFNDESKTLYQCVQDWEADYAGLQEMAGQTGIEALHRKLDTLLMQLLGIKGSDV